MLKYMINAEEHGKLSEDFKTLYVANGDNFTMQVEGATDKSKLDEFRASNVELLKNAKATEGINMDKYNAMLETERKVRDKELIASGDFDTLVAERLANQKSDFEARLETATLSATSATNNYHALLTKTEIEGAAFKAFGITKIRPEAHDAVMSQIKSTFTVEDGVVVGKSNGTILTGADGNLSIAEFVNNQPEFMRVPNAAGGGNPDEGGKPPMTPGRTSREKITEGLSQLLNK